MFKNVTKTNIILTFCSLIKIHLEKSKKTFVARLGRNGRAGLKLSYVCGGFNEKKSPLRVRQFINRAVRAVFSGTPTFSLFEKKVLVAPAPLTNSTKHIVRPQRRCSCEIDSTSAVPLLRIHETSVKPS